MSTSEEEGSCGNTGGDKEPSRGRGRTSTKHSRGRPAGLLSSGAGDSDTAAAGVGSRCLPDERVKQTLPQCNSVPFPRNQT